MEQTAVEWLAEKYDYVTWMRNHDEIYPEVAEKWKQHYLEQAKAMEKEQMIQIYKAAFTDGFNGELFDFEQYIKDHYEQSK